MAETDTNANTKDRLNCVYDVIVVGAGISGLTAAFEVLKKNPDAKLIILEAKGNKVAKYAYCYISTEIRLILLSYFAPQIIVCRPQHLAKG